jgi:hypothetical protein
MLTKAFQPFVLARNIRARFVESEEDSSAVLHRGLETVSNLAKSVTPHPITK